MGCRVLTVGVVGNGWLQHVYMCVAKFWPIWIRELEAAAVDHSQSRSISATAPRRATNWFTVNSVETLGIF